LPRFVLHFAGRARMRVASLFAPPFVHNWFVSMGMLNFALGVSIAMLLLVALDRQRSAPCTARALTVTALSLIAWFTHPLPLIVVALLAAVHALAQPGASARVAAARALGVPLLPALGALLASTIVHLERTTTPSPALGAATSFQTPAWLAYDLWAHWAYGYTTLSATSLFTMGTLAIFALRRAGERTPFFGPWGVLALVLAYAVAPYQTVGLGYAGSRVIPFIWLAALLRVPERLHRGLGFALLASAVLYAVGMGVDQVRLAREHDEFAAGVDAVPRGARLDVFVFSPRVTSKNTWSLSTSWGDYVTSRHAHTWEVPGDTPSLPLTWRASPPVRLETSAHHRMMDTMRTKGAFCAVRSSAGLDGSDCEQEWRAEGMRYYGEVDRFVDNLLMWDPPADTLEQVPHTWRVAYQGGRLWIFERARSTM
jgi:hypothetical protein